MIHQFLKKQVQKHYGTLEAIPADLFPLLQSISNCYYHYDRAKGTDSHVSQLNITPTTVKNNISYSHPSNDTIFQNTTHPIFKKEILDSRETNLQCEALLETSQRIAHIGSWQIDLDNRGVLSESIMSYSIEAYRILGCSPNDCGNTVADFLEVVYPEDKDKVLDTFEEAITTKSNYYCEHRILNRKGSIRYVTTRGEIKFDLGGVPWRIIGTIQDITERKQAEKKIKESNYRYQMVMKATQDVVWDWDIIQKTIFRSENYGVMFECETTEDNIYPELWVIHIHPDDRERVVQGVNAIIQQKTALLWEDEYRCIKGDSGEVYIQDRGYIIRDEHQKAVRIIGAMRNITPRKLSEIENHKITQDLIVKNKNLEQFAYIVSHNVRGPLTNILGLIQHIESVTLDSQECEFYKKGLMESALRLDEVVLDLNNILKVKHELTESFTLVAFQEMTDEVITELQHTVDITGITITTNYQKAESIFTLKSYLHSIFYNLLSNSIKYKDPLNPLFAEITSRAEDNMIILTFSDNGLGIDLIKHGDKLFGLYKRFHFHTEGKGMGLFMVKTQIETLGGTINVESSIREGTTFEIRLPNIHETGIEKLIGEY